MQISFVKPLKTLRMKLNKYYKTEILERFMDEEDLKIFHSQYEESKKVSIADRELMKMHLENTD